MKVSSKVLLSGASPEDYFYVQCLQLQHLVEVILVHGGGPVLVVVVFMFMSNCGGARRASPRCVLHGRPSWHSLVLLLPTRYPILLSPLTLNPLTSPLLSLSVLSLLHDHIQPSLIY